jgi:hypothetical protein
MNLYVYYCINIFSCIFYLKITEKKLIKEKNEKNKLQNEISSNFSGLEKIRILFEKLSPAINDDILNAQATTIQVC